MNAVAFNFAKRTYLGDGIEAFYFLGSLLCPFSCMVHMFGLIVRALGVDEFNRRNSLNPVKCNSLFYWIAVMTHDFIATYPNSIIKAK